MNLLKTIILGIVQGVTEFLPVSSSGHLAIAQTLLGISEDRILFLTVMFHFGTLLSVFYVYAQDIWCIIKEFLAMLFQGLTGKGFHMENPYRKLGVYIIVATIPTGLMGILLKDLFSFFYTSQLVVGIGLLITGTLLWSAEKIGQKRRTLSQMRWYDAAFVGFFQGLAITPGISRSGSTIVGSLFRGFDKNLATRFSFLISIPAILAATLLESLDAIQNGLGEVTIPMIGVGVLVSFLSGLVAIRAMIRLINREKLHYFSYYTWAVGLVVIIVTFLG